jgi:hypothetical protein
VEPALDEEEGKDRHETDGTPGQEFDEHVSNYVRSQLQRVRSQVSMGAYEDEFETQVDAANGNGNGQAHGNGNGNAANGR